MVFDYRCYFKVLFHTVYYRPALLNGRNVVDVLRTVCGPVDVSEAELTRIRKEVTERAVNLAQKWGQEEEGWEGVWVTSWEGSSVTAWENG